MRELLATTFTGIVVDENEQFYFVQKNGITFRLKKEEGTHAIGEAVEGFGYLNQKQEPAPIHTRHNPSMGRGRGHIPSFPKQQAICRWYLLRE